MPLKDLGVAPSTCGAPPGRSGIVQRERLVKTFVDVADVPVVLVTAPAGYGKSTAVQLWSETDDRPFAWSHLGPIDNDPVHLVRHIAAARHRVTPLEPDVLRVLAGAGRPIDTDLLPALGWSLAKGPPMVLVLDDAHLLSAEASLQVVRSLLEYLTPGWQLVISSRHLPDLRLARRRLGERVVEIGTRELAMDDVEASALFAHAGLSLDDAQLEHLIERTEGWPAGLGLAALALRGGSRPPDPAEPISTDRPVAEYLVEEVLEDLDEETATFLLRSSILDRMSASLLDEVLQTDGSGVLLDRILGSDNPFLVPLDHRGEWFRYHHLFGDALRFRLEHAEPELARMLRGRAAGALAELGDSDGAVRQAAAAGDLQEAADLVLCNTIRLIDEGRIGLLGQWLELLGAEVADRYPAAAIATAWYGIETTDARVLARAIHAAERLSWEGPLADGSPSLEVAVAAVRAVVGAEGVVGMQRDTDIVRNGGGPTTNPWWGFATCRAGTTAMLIGDSARARELFNAGLQEVAHSPSFEAAFRGQLALLEVYEDDLGEAERQARRAMLLCEGHNLEGVILDFSAYAGMALVAAKLNRADESRLASQRARRLLVRLGELSGRSRLRGYVALAEAAVAIGDYPEARAFAREAAHGRRNDPTNPYLNDRLAAVEAMIADVGDSVLDVDPISAAELRVLVYLPTHLTLREISDAIFLSRNTVKSHTVAIYRKLNVSSRGDAVVVARRLGLLDLVGSGASGASVAHLDPQD